MRAVRPKPSPAVLVSGLTAGLSEVSRFSCMKLPGVSGVFDYAGPSRDSRYRTCSCCLPPVRKRRRPDCLFSELNTQPTCTPVYASPCTSRYTAQNSGPSGSLLLSRRNLSFPASCRFIPAHPTVLHARCSAKQVVHPAADRTAPRGGARRPAQSCSTIVPHGVRHRPACRRSKCPSCGTTP